MVLFSPEMTNQKSLATASGLVLTVAAVVVWLLALHTASIYSFTTGFFLTRYEVKNFSDTQPLHSAQFQKAVIIVIDALRFDFALHNFSLDQPYPTPYTNRLPAIFETLRDEPQRSYLFKFVADPPTTTMQVRGMTSISLLSSLNSILPNSIAFSNVVFVINFDSIQFLFWSSVSGAYRPSP